MSLSRRPTQPVKQPKPMPRLLVDAYGRKRERDHHPAESGAVEAKPAPNRKVSPHARAATMAISQPHAAVLKTVRELPAAGDKSRLWGHVASLPCQLCGAHGVQVAHSNSLSDGKSRGMKASEWRVAALCPSCHVAIDSGKDFTKEERRSLWVQAHHETMGELFAQGLIRPV